MSLRVYNTLTRRKEEFVPVNPPEVRMYLCGPTVYKSPHVGHMVGPIIFDAIKRYLTHKGFKVTWIVNITDVDDKLIEAAGKRGVPMDELARKYAAEYMEVLKLLGVDQIDLFPKASEHMQQIIDLCQALIGRNAAYVADGNVWFSVASKADYGKLSGRSVEQQESGLRNLEGVGKRQPADFALWKSAKPGEPSWPSPWGPGRPGWHIECSAMSKAHLGDTFDIHGGGLDLQFPHHENELAQSEAATGKPFATYWLHNGLTRMKTKAASGEWANEKMSGSIGNVVSALQLIEKHGADTLRYVLLSTHYRSPIDFGDDTIQAGSKGLDTFARLFERIARLGSGPAELPAAFQALEARFFAAMDDDFNTAGAIASLHEMASLVNSTIEREQLEKAPASPGAAACAAMGSRIRELGKLLGLFRVAPRAAAQDDTLDRVMSLLISLRAQAKKDKNFALADQIRKGLADAGVMLEDRADGTLWRRKP